MSTISAELTDPAAQALMADWLAAGTIVGHGFANFYAITARPEAEWVRRVNLMKGRPEDQVGSIAVPPSRIAEQFDWTMVPDRRKFLSVIDTFYGIGPFGFRGPATPDIPDHLTQVQDGVRTVQVIAPGYACPSNTFLTRCLDAAGTDLLYVTSANRSRHSIGADDSPAHWQAAGLLEEFGEEPDFALLQHKDEGAARAAYPRFAPMSTSVLSFGPGGLKLERHGSLAVDDIREILTGLGIGFGPGVSQNPKRLSPRAY